MMKYIIVILRLIRYDMAAYSRKEEQIAQFAKALAHPARIAIIGLLIKKQSCICGDIVDELPLSQSTVSQHLKELKEGFKKDVDPSDKPAFESAIKELMDTMKIKNIMVTLSERGVMISNGEQFDYIPAHIRKIADVSEIGRAHV